MISYFMISDKGTKLHFKSPTAERRHVLYTDIEWAFLDIDVFFDIGISRYRSFELRYRCFFDIVLSRYRFFCFDFEYSSISYWIDIEYFYLRYRYFRDLEHSISNYKSFDIEFNIVSRYRRSFINARYRAFQFQYRNMPISKVRRSISNVAKVPDDIVIVSTKLYMTSYV